jgi:hypothetical protein
MTRILYARIALAFIAIAVLGYGINADRRDLRYAAMGILLVALILRFVPSRWLEDTKEDK